jgi:hypothetical protein
MNQATKKLLLLRPVTFRYKQAQNDGSHPLQYGLIAEEVADVYPDLVQYDSKTGEPNTALYHVLPAMLLNEFQKTAQTGGGATGRDPITAGRTGSVGGANPAVADRDDGAQSRENRTAKSLPFSAPISRVQ